MQKLFLTTLTKAINSYLHLDPESEKRLKKLRDKIVTIELLPFHFVFQCHFTEEGVAIRSDETLAADTTIRGTPMQMMGVMLNKDNRQKFFAEDVMMEGNAELGQQVIQLFDELHIDWEEHLSKLVGDVPAYHAGKLLKSMTHWFKNAEKNFTQDVDEYMHEEAQCFPTKEAVDDFFNEIDVLRMDVDRLDARLHSLKKFVTDDEGSL